MAMMMGVMSGLLGAVGSFMQASAAADAANQNAAIANYNRQVAERNKAAALAESRSEQDDKHRENRRQLSSIRAAYGSSGLMLEGSPLDVIEDTALEQELDVAKIGYKGQVRAIGYKDEANNYAMQRDLYKMEAKNAKTAGVISAAAGFLGGLGKVQGAGTSLLRAA